MGYKHDKQQDERIEALEKEVRILKEIIKNYENQLPPKRLKVTKGG